MAPGVRVTELDETTWPAFADLLERNNGVWGGCWCMGFHEEGVGRGRTPAQNRANKERRVREGRAYEAALTGDLPDWRITCFFVDKGSRRRGIASAALDGALEHVARRGGGTVESFPEDAAGRKVSSSFLNNGTVALFEHHGFERTRRLGKHHWLVALTVSPSRAPAAGARARRAARRSR